MSLSFPKRPALVAYVTCGDPNLVTTRAVVLAAIEAGADIIELGVPFSDPVADGPVIQRASERALRRGTSLEQVLELGIDRVILGTIAITDRALLEKALERWGERIVVGIDARGGLVSIAGWRETSQVKATTLAGVEPMLNVER